MYNCLRHPAHKPLPYSHFRPSPPRSRHTRPLTPPPTVLSALPRNVIIARSLNDGRELAQYAYVLRHFPAYEVLLFMQDTTVPINRGLPRISMRMQKGDAYAIRCGTYPFKKGSGLDRIDEIYSRSNDTLFIANKNPNDLISISCHNTFAARRDLATRIVYTLDEPYASRPDPCDPRIKMDR